MSGVLAYSGGSRCVGPDAFIDDLRHSALRFRLSNRFKASSSPTLQLSPLQSSVLPLSNMSAFNALPSTDDLCRPHPRIIDAVHQLERGITLWLDYDLPLCSDWTEEFLRAAVSFYPLLDFFVASHVCPCSPLRVKPRTMSTR